MDGRFGDAMNTLNSTGCASPDDQAALAELQARHPDHDLPTAFPEVPPPLVVEAESVLGVLARFPVVLHLAALSYGHST